MKSTPLITLLLLAGTALSNAAVIASGLRDITITSDFDGVYLDVDAGTAGSTETVGWDINLFFGGEAVGTSPAFQAARTTIALDAPILSLPTGQTVDGTLNFLTGYAGSETHVGNGAGQFASGSEGYIGFSFTTNDSSGPYYGWMKLVLANDGSTGLIREWAYENTGAAITVGSTSAAPVPEPAVIYPVLLGVIGLCLRRGRPKGDR